MERDLDAQLEPFGLAVAEKLGLAVGARVLDIGCGAGATSLMLADRVRPGRVLGVDISVPLLERARERAQDRGIGNLEFERADAQTFALDAASYDIVFSRFGVMFFADPVSAFRNLLGALRPGGKLGFVCWRAMDENPSFTVPLRAALPFLAEPPPPLEPRAPGPFALAERGYLQSILEGAGYTDIELVAHNTKLVFAGRPDIDGAVELALQVGPLSRAVTNATEQTREQIRAAVRDAFAPYHGPSGVELDSATWLVSARREA